MRLFIVAGMVLGFAIAATDLRASTVGFTLDPSGTRLFRFNDLDAPGLTGPDSSRQIRDASGRAVAISDIEVRTATGEIFGYSAADAAIYRIDPRSGRATRVADAETAPRGGAAGIDFNPMVDRARVVSTAEDNLLFVPEGDPASPVSPRLFGNDATVQSLRFAADDANAGADPAVFGNAYTNAVLGLAPAGFTAGGIGTQQYVLDAATSTIGTLNNNGGLIRTLGRLVDGAEGLAFTDLGGFDILATAPGANLGYALLTSADMGLQELVSFLLIDGAPVVGDVALASRVALAAGAGFRGLAVADGRAFPAPVPLPASLVLLAAGIGGLGALRVSRRAARG